MQHYPRQRLCRHCRAATPATPTLTPIPLHHVPRRSVAHAAKDNGGVCTFPYCGCWTDFNAPCLQVSAPVVSGDTYSFTISSTCTAPMRHGCPQDLNKVEFNTCECAAMAGARFRMSPNVQCMLCPGLATDAPSLAALTRCTVASCRWSRVRASYTWQGTTVPIPTPTFDGNSRDILCSSDIQVRRHAKRACRLVAVALHSTCASMYFREDFAGAHRHSCPLCLRPSLRC